jgi:phenylacetate-coenzyme A ligase PaaK-like adenylate-forming protein
MLADLCCGGGASQLRIQPQRIVTICQAAAEEIRHAAQRAWGAPVANLWGTSEAPLSSKAGASERHPRTFAVVAEAAVKASRRVPFGLGYAPCDT